MPELPEVETFRRYLIKFIVGEVFEETTVYYEKIFKKPNSIEFIKKIKNQKIVKIERRGKYLFFFLTKNVLIVHFRMEGRFIIQKNKIKNNISRNVLVQFKMKSGLILNYEDSRRFGTFHLESLKSYIKNKGIAKLGLEPFDKKLTVNYLWKNWNKRKINIKTALLEQTVIAGIGNIYASEILYACKISPFKVVNSIQKTKLKKIIQNLKIIMKRAIQLNGTTAYTFKIGNHLGEYWKMLKVYQKRGENCQNCSNKIQFVKINQRGTFFCSRCQKNC